MYSKEEGNYGSYSGQKDLLTDDVTTFNQVEYAGFWLRFAAYIIDAIIAWIILTILFMIFGLGSLFFRDTEEIDASVWGAVGFVYLAVFLYFPLMECSKWQATLGKRAVGIMVTDSNGNRISFLKALGRTLGKILSALIIYIGFIMAGLTEKKQALHDLLANTLVVRGNRA